MSGVQIPPPLPKGENILDRYIELEGTSNFRDLGGYKTSNGSLIRKGIVFRSDNLSHLTSSDIEKVKRLGIKTVCDFRSDFEMQEFPSPFNNKSSPKLLHIPIKTLGAQDLQELALREGVTSEELANELQLHYVLYVNQHKKKYSKFLNTIAYGDIPLVFHCFAGKDRTGFGSLLFLGLMGVDKDTIIDDYLLTNNFYKGPIQGSNWKDSISETLKPLFEARADYINAAFNEIYSRYEKLEDFVIEELNVDLKTIDLIKEKILE